MIQALLPYPFGSGRTKAKVGSDRVVVDFCLRLNPVGADFCGAPRCDHGPRPERARDGGCTVPLWFAHATFIAGRWRSASRAGDITRSAVDGFAVVMEVVNSALLPWSICDFIGSFGTRPAR